MSSDVGSVPDTKIAVNVTNVCYCKIPLSTIYETNILEIFLKRVIIYLPENLFTL